MNLEEIKALAEENKKKYEEAREQHVYEKRKTRIKELERKINNLQEKLGKLKGLQAKQENKFYEFEEQVACTYPHNNKFILSKIAEEIMARHEELNSFEILGSFGLNCEYGLWFFENELDSIGHDRTSRIKASLTFFGTSQVWTGELSNKYEKGSIGELNGENYIMTNVKSIEQLDKFVVKSLQEHKKEVKVQ